MTKRNACKAAIACGAKIRKQEDRNAGGKMSKKKICFQDIRGVVQVGSTGREYLVNIQLHRRRVHVVS